MTESKRHTGNLDETSGQSRPAKANRRSLLRRGAGGVAALGAVLLATDGAANVAQAQDGPELRGTWLAQLQRDNPPPGFGPTRFLFTFTVDGDVISAGPPVLIENSVRAFLTTQLGQWRTTGPGSFSFSFNTASYGEDGVFNYSISSRMEMLMASDRRSWTGTYVRQDVAADGTTIRSLTGTASAQQV